MYILSDYIGLTANFVLRIVSSYNRGSEIDWFVFVSYYHDSFIYCFQSLFFISIDKDIYFLKPRTHNCNEKKKPRNVHIELSPVENNPRICHQTPEHMSPNKFCKTIL